MRRLFLVLLSLFFLSFPALAGNWTQFRGPGGSGQPEADRPLPTEIGPERNVLWKVPLAPGHSSPVVLGERIFLTIVRDKKLFTVALDRNTGKTLWEKEAPYKQLEQIHAIGSHAQATCATDGERVISFFGSCGMFCYDLEGKELWHLPLGPFKNILGAGSSPIIAGDLVLLNQDHDIDSFLIAVDKRTGKQKWRVDRSEFWVGYCTPFIWTVNGKKQVVVAGSLKIVGYDLETGKEIWHINGMARAVHMTPTLGPDNILYVAGWTGGGDESDRIDAPTFAELLEKHDKNKNGTLEQDELPKGPLADRFSMMDRNKDGHITKTEYEFARNIFNGAMNRIVAIKPGGTGDIGNTHVLWSQRKYLSVIPSPQFYKGLIYMARDGGIATVIDAKTGEVKMRERLAGTGNYYASPVVGDGKVYFVSQRGDLTVAAAGPEWKILHRDRFGEDVFGTPALVDGKIYFRTMGHLYCFGKKE
jgi:outer membrane protein assembly factor BamB